jgi:hypothetical protein
MGGALAVAGGETTTPGFAIKVFNTEVACHRSRVPSCRLGLVRDPYAPYVVSNVVGHTLHGNRLIAECYIPDGTRVGSEDLYRSTRWYRVRTASASAWLPGARAWPGTTSAVPRCAA